MMFVVLLGLVTVIAGAVAWSAYRHRQQAAWDRELDTAFARRDLQEMPRHRVL